MAALVLASCGSSGTATTTRPAVETTEVDAETAGPTIDEEDIPEEITPEVALPIDVASLTFNIPEGWVGLQQGDDVAMALKSSSSSLHQEISDNPSTVQRITEVASTHDLLIMAPRGDLLTVEVAATEPPHDTDLMASSLDQVLVSDGLTLQEKEEYEGALGSGFLLTYSDTDGFDRYLLVNTGEDLIFLKAPGEDLELAEETLDKVIESTALNT